MGTKRGAIAAPRRAALASFLSLKPASAVCRTSTVSRIATRTTLRKEAISAKEEHESTVRQLEISGVTDPKRCSKAFKAQAKMTSQMLQQRTERITRDVPGRISPCRFTTQSESK